MIRVKKKEMPGKDLGYVGEVKSVDTTLLEALIEDDFVPVISPIGLGDNYEPYILMRMTQHVQLQKH